jgi:hypothetical protein
VVTLTFKASGPNPADDPSIQFSTGGRSATFTIPANQTHAVFTAPQLAVQAGSVTGTITLTVGSLQAGGAALAGSGSVSGAMVVLPAAPMVRSAALVQTSGGFQLQVVGLSNTRELTQATVNFQPAAGSSLQTTQLVVPLAGVAQGWFQGTDSAPYGGQFTLTMPFAITGAGNVGAVTVTLSNSVGDSLTASASF